jgi:hypothetical protein
MGKVAIVNGKVAIVNVLPSIHAFANRPENLRHSSYFEHKREPTYPLPWYG